MTRFGSFAISSKSLFQMPYGGEELEWGLQFVRNAKLKCRQYCITIHISFSIINLA